jgi:SAM-dependent methyltransferase
VRFRPLASIEALAGAEDVYWGLLKAIQMLPDGAGQPPARLLEIGAGLGYTTYCLRQSGLDVTGYDLSELATRSAAEAFGNYYASGSFQDFFCRNEHQFDAVFLTEVIEHFPDPKAIIVSLSGLLKPRGHIILTTPNRLAHSSSVVWAVTEPPVHCWWLAPASIKKLAEAAGMEAAFVDFGAIGRTVAPGQLKGPSLPGAVLTSNWQYNDMYFDHHGSSAWREYARLLVRMLVRRGRSRIPARMVDLEAASRRPSLCMCAVLSRPSSST